MGIRFIILTGLLASASLAQAGPVSFGGSGVVKSTFAVGTLNKVGEFGRSEAAPASFLSAPNTPAPFAAGSSFAVGPADTASLGNGGVTGGSSSPPPFAASTPAAAAPVFVAPVDAAPAFIAPVASAPVVNAPAVSPEPAPAQTSDAPAAAAPAPIADVGNAEELLEVLIPAVGVPAADQLQDVPAAADVGIAAIPEPSTGFLMLAGLLGAGALSRRSKRVSK